MESILISIKKLLGSSEDYHHFDDDIIMHINTAFLSLTQIGVGPENGFMIEDETAYWEDFLPGDPAIFQAVKICVYQKVRLLFDPPLSSAVIEAINRQIAELEWRLRLAAGAE